MEEQENSLVARKWVRIMCDFSADGVWDKEGCCCDADDLPVPADLIARIRAWQAKYEYEAPTPASEDYVPGSFDDRAFSREGLAIAQAVKRALPDWTVIYFDEARSNEVLFRGQKADRPYFEYEVDL